MVAVGFAVVEVKSEPLLSGLVNYYVINFVENQKLYSSYYIQHDNGVVRPSNRDLDQFTRTFVLSITNCTDGNPAIKNSCQ
jgi:hypothetical protein